MNQVKEAKKLLDEADAVLIGAAAGLSTAAGLDYAGQRFQQHFSDYIEKYGMTDMYSAGFYPFQTLEEKWAYWSRHVLLNRYGESLPLYQDLYHLVKDKEYFVMTTNVDGQFEKAGFELVKERNKNIDFVVLGFDTTLTYEKLWIACEYIANGVEYIATHPDFNCPLENGKFMPDAGAMMAFIKASTGKEPIVIGKPNKYIIEAIIEKYDLKKSELAMVGDRLYTDIRTGIDNGLTSILVMSGETDKKMLDESIYKPDYIFHSVKELKEKIE